MAFDPNQPFEEVEEVGFDPNLPFELVEEPVGTSVEQEVSQLGAALKSGIAQPLQAMGVTAETIGMPAVGAALKGAVEQPEGYVTAAQRFMEPQAGEAQLGGFAFQYLPRAIVEQVGQLAGSVASRAAGGVIGGAAGSVVPGAGTAVGAGIGMFTGPALFEAAQIVGPVAQERAKNNGREVPNSEDLAYAWTTAGAGGALNAIGAKYLPGGEKAVGALTKRIAASFLGEGATEGAQALAQQTGETIFTEKGLEIKPKAAIGEALIGGVSAGGATIVMSPLQKEQVDIEKEADLESRDLSIPADDPAVRANLDKANILEQENKDSLAIINKFGVESEEGKAAQQTIVDNSEEITKLNETLPTGLSLPITTAEQQQIELAKQIARKPAELGEMPSPAAQTAEATYGAATGVYDVFGGVSRKPAPTVKQGLPFPPATKAPVTPEVKPVKEAIISVDKTESFNQELEQKKDFNPPALPSLQDARSVPDKVAKKGNTLSISGGSQEAVILNNKEAKKKFDKIGYERQEIVLPDDMNEKVSGRYGSSIANIKSLYSMFWLGAHFHGGIAISETVKGTQRGRVVAHELGHASHSLLGDQINKDQEVLNELAKIEDLLYPGLREKIQSSKNPDVKFFNYLLSADELIAEFNVERITNPEQAAQVAPKLTSLLGSVEKDKRLVADRKTFPVILGAIKETKKRLKVKGLDPREIKRLQKDKLARGSASYKAQGVIEEVKKGELKWAKIRLRDLKEIANKEFVKRTVELSGSPELMDYFNELYPEPAPVSETITEPAAIVEQEPVAPAEQPFAETTGDAEIDAKITKTETMSPDEYLRQAWEATDGKLGVSYEEWLSSNRLTDSDRAKYSQAMMRGEKFPLPYIDKYGGSQDGRNRALAAKEAGIQEIPVGIIEEPSIDVQIQDLRNELSVTKSKIGRSRIQERINRLESTSAPAPVTTPAPAETPAAPAALFKQQASERREAERIDKENAPIKFTTQKGSQYSIGESGAIYRDKFDGKKYKADKIGFVSKDSADAIAKLPKQYEGKVVRVIHETDKVRFVIDHQLPTENTILEAPSTQVPKEGMFPIEGSNFIPHLGDAITSIAPAPAAPAAEPAGIAVGNRVKTKTTPQSYVVEEVLPQSARDAELGEQYYRIKNERTGESQTVEANEIKPVKGKGVRKMAAATRNEEYMRLAQDPEANREQLQRMVDEAAKKAEPPLPRVSSFEIRGNYVEVIKNATKRERKSLESNGMVGEILLPGGDTLSFNRMNALHGEILARLGLTRKLVITGLLYPDGFVITDRTDGSLIGKPSTVRLVRRKYGVDDVIPFNDAIVGLWENLGESPSPLDPVTYDDAGNIIPLEERFQATSPDIRRMAEEIRVEEDAQPVADQYTYEEAANAALDLFGGTAPEGFVIVNDSTDPDFRFKAGYDPETGEIILNLAFIRKGENIADIIGHELGHYIFSDPQFQSAFQDFWNAMTPEQQAEGDRIVNQFYNKETGAVQMEEKQVRAFMQLVQQANARPMWQRVLDAIKKWINEKLGTNFKTTDRGALAVLAVAHKRFQSGEQIIREMESGVLRMAEQPAPEKPAEAKPSMERYKGKAQVAGVPGIGAEKDTPKGINKKTEAIIRDRVFDATIVNDNQTKKAWNLIQKIEDKNPDAGKNAQAINELTRETMQDVEADEVVKQTIGAVKLRNELYAYAIKLAGEGDTKMLNYLRNTRLSIGSGSIVEGDAGRLLQAMASLKSWIVRATEAEQTGFFTIAAQQFFDTKAPTDEQVQQIKNIFNKVKEVKIDQEKELMDELEEVGKAAGIDLPAAVDKQLENTPGLDPMVVAITNMLKMGGTFIYRPTKNKIGEAVKNTINKGITNYRNKLVSKAATGLETGFWKTLSSTEQKPGPLGELDSAQNRALGNIVKKTLVDMKLQGTPPNTKMSIYEQVASILGEQPLSQDKIKMADEKIRSTIKDKRQAELDNATEDQQEAINLKYDEMTFAWDNAMSRSLDMPVSDTMLRRMILNELKEADTSIQDIAKLMEEEPVIGASRQDRYVESIIEKILGSGRYLTRINAQGKPEADYTNLKTYLSSLLENMVLARQQKNQAAKDTAKLKRDAGGDPEKQAQAQIDKLAKVQADPTIFGEKRVDPVRNVVRDALALQLNIGFTPEQSAKIKAGWKGAFVADPNKKGLPSSFMLELQRLGVSESAANTLADIVWRQIEINALSRQMDATTKAVEAGPIGGIVQAILDTPLANQQDPEWRKKVIVDYLKNAGVKPSQAENIAKLFDISLRKRFAKAQEEAAIKAAKSIEGGLNTNSRRALEKFLKAIRAQVLDPGKDVAKAFAEEMGWKGFTSEQIVRLNELDAIVNDTEKTDAETAVALEQIQQIIDKVSAPPQIKEVLGSFYIGNALMRFPTFAVQAFDPLAMATFNTAIESFRNITNPQQFIQTWVNYGRAVANLARETAFSFKNDVLRSGRMIDYLNNEDRKIKRLWDEAEKKWKRGDIRGAMKDGIVGYTTWTFRTLKALDDGAYSLLTSTTLPQYVEAALKNAKIPREKRRGVMRQVLEAREMDIKRMVAEGVSKNDAVVYANERMQAAITKELSGLNINAQEVINSAINDSLARIGKTRFAEDILTGKTEEIKDLGTISAPFLRWYESVSKSVSGSGSESQKIFYRILLGFPLIPARIFNIAAGYTPLTIYRHALKSRYSLTYGTALQRRQRLAEQLAGTMVLLPLLALRSNSTDEEDEKEKGFGVYITGQGPSKMKDKTLHAKWNDRHDPFSLEFRMGGKTKFSIDAKAAGPLSVMIYLLGAMDDWETNRKLDGLKTSKDDWKEAQDNASIFTSLYDLAGYAVLTTARRGPTTGVMQGLVDFRRFPDDPIAAIGADVAFSAMPAVPILGTGIAKNLSDFLSQPIDNTTKEGAILSNIPIVGPIAGKPALNSYGQKIGELRVSEKLKKSFGVPFTLVVSDSEEDNKLTSLTLKFGDGPTPLRREDVENELKSAISDEEWYLAAKTFGDRNRSYILKNYNRYEKMKPAGFSKLMSALGKASKANAIAAVKKARRNNP